MIALFTVASSFVNSMMSMRKSYCFPLSMEIHMYVPEGKKCV
jgi:hypothetical protein